MVITSSNTRFPVVFLALFICSLKSSQEVSGFSDQQRNLSTATTMISIKTDPKSVSSLREARTYSVSSVSSLVVPKMEEELSGTGAVKNSK